jgi:orotate phosphoribosyltransferase
MEQELKPYQTQFIDFILSCEVLSFGEFTLKSGRLAPYFFNLGKINKSSDLTRIGEFYAKHLLATFSESCNVVFGPAYKAIPLAVATSTALEKLSGAAIMFSFDRKEVKTRGEGGMLVGRQLSPGDRVIIVEDVVTAGTTLKNSIPLIRSFPGVNLLGVLLAIDRKEKGAGTISALEELEQGLQTKIAPIISIHDVVHYLKEKKNSAFLAHQSKIADYLETYGA